MSITGAFVSGTINISGVTGDIVITASASAGVVTSISAVYTQSGTVYDTDTLDSLRDDLVVTATYEGGTTGVVTTYTLSGTLSESTSTITVSYGGKTDTFSVTVAQSLSYIQSDGASYIDTGFTHTVNTKVVLDYMSLKASGESFQCPVGSSGVDDSASNNPFYFFIGSSNNVNGSMGQPNPGSGGNGENFATRDPSLSSAVINSGDRYTYVMDSKNGVFSIGSTDYSVRSGVYSGYDNASLALFARKHPTVIAAYAVGRIYSAKIYDNDVVIADYVPTLSNGVYGLHDKVSGAFLTNSGSGTLTGALEVVESISAVYTQSGTVYDTDTLDSLKADLVVTAIMSDQSSRVLSANEYTLSGTLTGGTSTITVTYGGATDTFNVTVWTVPVGYTAVAYVQSDGASYFDTGIVHTINTKVVIDYMSLKAAGESFQCPLGSAGTDDNASYNPFQFYIGSQNGIDGSMGGTRTGVQGNGLLFTSANADINNLLVNNGDRNTYTLDSKNAKFYVNDDAYTVTSNVDSNYGNPSIALLARKHPTQIKAYAKGRLYSAMIYESDTLRARYTPVKRDADNVYGLFDSINEVFLTNSGGGTVTGP